MKATEARPSPLLRWLGSNRFASLWQGGITALLVIFLVVLAWQTCRRAIFPWDLHIWSESPFLTDMLKLDHGGPVYTTPADVNSFVYSPTLEYVTFALLKPFGKELDIRYCRLLIILIGIGAAGFGALAMKRLARSRPELGLGRGAFLAGWAALVLVLFKNFTSDVPHPDGLHAVHALLVFWLCFTAVETKNFNLALVAMVIAGLGVLAKQTDALCAGGAAIAFALMNPWGWRRWFILAVVGAIVFGLSLWWLWSPPFAKFYTFELLSHQNISFSKLFVNLPQIFSRERIVILLLGLLAIPFLRRAQGPGRRYLICALAVGLAAGLPNTMAFMKQFGEWNNLGVLEIFLVVIIWPLVWNYPKFWQAQAAGSSGGAKRLIAPGIFGGLGVVFVLLLVPIKATPPPGYYKYCETITASIKEDVKAGRKIMVSHGAEFLILAGNLDVPRDRANSYLELEAGNSANLAGTEARIRSRYYDRIYLFLDFGFGHKFVEVFHQNYDVIGKVPEFKLTPRRGYASGFQNNLWNDCEILAPKTK